MISWEAIRQHGRQMMRRRRPAVRRVVGPVAAMRPRSEWQLCYACRMEFSRAEGWTFVPCPYSGLAGPLYLCRGCVPTREEAVALARGTCRHVPMPGEPIPFPFRDAPLGASE